MILPRARKDVASSIGRALRAFTMANPCNRGPQVAALKFTPRADVDLLEQKLKKSIYEKTPPNTNTKRTAELAFKALDKDGSGGVNINEFINALERFGMHVRTPSTPSGRTAVAGQHRPLPDLPCATCV